MSEGWWKLEKDECATVIKRDLQKRYFYFRATNRKGEFIDQGYKMCTTLKPFTIKGDKDCRKRGYTRRGFAKIDTGSKGKNFTFTIKPQKIPVVKRPEPAGPKPGTYGEPLTITAVFIGCDRIDGVLACDMTANDWLYRVIDDGRSPEELLNRLDALAMNQTVGISGDLVNQGDKTIEITIRSVTAYKDTKKSRLLNGLVGSWRSMEDDNSTIRFTRKKIKYDYYSGDLIDSGKFVFSKKCPRLSEDSSKPLLIVKGKDGGTYCYDIATINRESLELIYLPRGNMLRYSRNGN